MFDTALVRTGLERLFVKLVREDVERHDALAAELDELHREFDHRRELLAETFEYLVGRLRAGDQLSRAALTGADLTPLPPHLRTEWQAVWGEQYLRGEFALYASKEREDTEARRLELADGPKNAKLRTAIRQVLVILDAYLGKTISYSTWERLRLPADLLSKAVAAAHEAGNATEGM